MRERSNCRIYGCIERRRLGSVDNWKGSIDTSHQSISEEPDDGKNEDVERKESKRAEEFI